MKTPAELLSELKEALGSMEKDFLSIGDYAHLLQGVTEGKGVSEEHIPGMYRLLLQIVDHADNIRKRHDVATVATRRLANP